MASLYLHIPFCERKCLYCDFYSVENLDAMEAFLHAIDLEIDCYSSLAAGTTFDTVFFGGGTPSLLTPSQLERLLQKLHERYTIHPGAELTLETNPGTVSVEKLVDYRSLGINRLSIGIQSLRDSELGWLGRIHDARSAVACVEYARQAGFENVGIDLIYSLPGQDISQWNETIEKALDLAPDHVSAYSLIVEDNTPLARLVAARQVSPNPAEREAELFEQTMAVLGRHGFE
ncbi:MAG TPA: radical SAM family heme chaperone HemW, partial [Bacteroidota bacterium]|nr:radical SAM family heme chaperone HemW [Bacteroidota bacterium]